MRLKTCKACKVKFEPKRPMQSCCDIPCAITHANNLKAKKQRSDYKEGKKKLKTKSDYAKEAQISINRYRREFTRHLGCISCGTHQGQMQGGHFRSVGGHGELRYVEENIWCQCSRCNERLSGNLLEYRKRLITLIGVEKVEWLEGKHEIPHHTIDDLISIKKKYDKLFKELNNAIR